MIVRHDPTTHAPGPGSPDALGGAVRHLGTRAIPARAACLGKAQDAGRWHPDRTCGYARPCLSRSAMGVAGAEALVAARRSNSDLNLRSQGQVSQVLSAWFGSLVVPGPDVGSGLVCLLPDDFSGTSLNLSRSG